MNPHRPVDMGEEQLVASAKIVETRLALGCRDETIARTFALAGKQHLAVAAILGQGFELVLPELTLLPRGRKLEQGRLVSPASRSKRSHSFRYPDSKLFTAFSYHHLP